MTLLLRFVSLPARISANLLGLLLISTLLTSCHTLSKQQCERGDWGALGREDALAGRPVKKRYDIYQRDCAEHSIVVDKQKYLVGYTQGAREFCTAENGRRFARAGGVYEETCSNQLAEDFLSGYTPARRLFLADKERREAEEAAKKASEEKAKKEASDKIEWASNFLRDHKTKTCTFNSECNRDGDCAFGKCKSNGGKCTFNSDCKEEGRCNTGHECWHGRCDRISYCKYD